MVNCKVTPFDSDSEPIGVRHSSIIFVFIYIFRDDRDRNDEIQQLIARAEFNARQYMTNFNLTTLSSSSTLVKIVPLSSSTKIS